MASRVNRRNYYRILHVQPDAPVEIIRASYRTLMHKLRYHPDLGGDDWNAALLNEALQVLSDEQRRDAYDEECAASAKAMHRAQPDAEPETAGVSAEDLASDRASATAVCPFCALPSIIEVHSSCARCDAPLSPPHSVVASVGDQRRYSRLALNAPLRIHSEWTQPVGISGRIRDLSPGGMQAEVSTPLQPGQVVMLGSELLDAVARVATCHVEGAVMIAGFGFLTLRFHDPRGTFISAHA